MIGQKAAAFCQVTMTFSKSCKLHGMLPFYCPQTWWAHCYAASAQFEEHVCLACTPLPRVPVSRATHHVHTYLMSILNPRGPFAGIGAVHKQGLDRGVLGSCLGHRFGGGIPILPVRGADTHGQEQAQGIHHKAALAPFTFLPAS